MNISVPSDCTEKFLKSANTPHLKAGCEPKLLYAAGILAFLSGLWLMNRWGILVAAFLFLFSRAIARRMAQEDPYMTTVLSDALKYARAYPARPAQAILVRVKR